MLIQDLINVLEGWASPSLAETYDNPRLLVGDPNHELSGAVISLDLTQAVIDFAKQSRANLIISHHPIWFGSKNHLTAGNWVNDLLIDAIKSDIALYAFHTNLDNVRNGVNAAIAEQIGLREVRVLAPKPKQLQLLSVYVPATHRQAVQEALFEAGAGSIGNYDRCSFYLSGTGTFRPLENANPFLGTHHVTEFTQEEKIEVTFSADKQLAVVQTLKKAHPYEEIAYQIITTENHHADIGSGAVGLLPEPLSKVAFLSLLQDRFQADGIRFSETTQDKIQKVAICGGSGSFLIPQALKKHCDALVTADITYHRFFEPNGKMLLVDIGHFESEQFTAQHICHYIQQKIPNFAASIFTHSTNPVRYFR